MNGRKLFLWVAIAAAAAAFFVFDLQRYFSLDELKRHQAALTDLHARAPVVVMGAYFLIYLAVTALSLPGAAVLTLAGGALFGLAAGTVIVSFASSVGALLAFLVARYLLRDAVQQRFGARLAQINAGIERDGAFYLFTLRLVPVVPFFIINLAMGLTRMKAWPFYWVSQLGMLAGTVVYVNAGTQLARIDSLAGILSPALVGSFVLLGVFPWVARRALGTVQRGRVYARWRSVRPRRYDRNLVVIGAGAAGLVSAYIAATVRAKVTLVERHKMGGDCLNHGCVPSKALIRSAKLAHQMRHASRYGLADTAPAIDFAQVMDRVRRVIAEIEPHDAVDRYIGLGVDVVQGHARLVNPWTVAITREDGSVQTLTTRAVILATGAEPFVPDLPGLKEVGCLTSDTLWTLRMLPRRLIVLGGGPIGCELAQAFARLGAEVTQVEMAPRLMLKEDEDAARLVQASLERDGVRVLTTHRALRCEPGLEGKRLIAEHEGREVVIEGDEILCAVGRVARLQGHGLEALGIPTGRVIETNDHLETLYPNIYAAGDAAGPFQFTHTAAHQAWYAAVNALFGSLKTFKADYSVIPWATFTDPEVARVGLSEDEARRQGVAFEVTRYGIDDLDRAIADGQAHGFVKILTVPGKDRILGVTIVGEHAADLLAEFVLAMKHGLGLNKILGTLHIYPTLAEANKYAAGEWKKAHKPEALLRWVERYHAWRRGE
ncbi:FAD-dependent oxidoreductase [Caldimonas caldifontis]|uniref:Pyridine nucleotide-disulfide oxidoreductase n=1 Tax=Caldimonas caldifontis TaxID=1452508 RepID=A0A2S5SSG6_9BURK|nr:bifunctional TVP38/TMEM64 family protein/FAD-dependent oxidoreductase [Caldimonas caldifontis]PPE65671.1 pyridine nucleotide-disulfide oxidoreductase [Caldimonas caldifontis]